MAPFSIPAPSIVPLRLPIFGGPKSIDTNTKVELLCDTFLDYEIFYTLDGTKPQPYAGIVQGSKLIKYTSPICLPPGKITIRAIAINANIHSMCSNVVTKRFEVVKVKSAQTSKEKSTKNTKLKEQVFKDERSNDMNKFNSKATSNNEKNNNCFEEAFIDTVEFEMVNYTVEDDGDDQNEFLNATLDEVSLESDDFDDSNDPQSYVIANDSNEISCTKAFEQEESNATVKENETLNSSNNQCLETQFCCMKCDMTLQHCLSCNRMNAVSSKFCIECGMQLTQICCSCQKPNPTIASFCQYCGKKLGGVRNSKLDTCLKVDSYVMAKPQLRHASIQQLPVVMTKGTQTAKNGTPVKKVFPKFDIKKMPRQSPGRGYWHQQLDYICNNLKSHAYNNIEFRKTISEPILCDFQSAFITKDENSISVTVVFSPFSIDKNNIIESKENKSTGSS